MEPAIWIITSVVVLFAYYLGWNAGWRAGNEVAKGYMFGHPPECFEGKVRKGGVNERPTTPRPPPPLPQGKIRREGTDL